MNTLIAVIAFAVVLTIPVVAIIATFRPTRHGVGQAIRTAVAFDPQHPDVRYR